MEQELAWDIFKWVMAIAGSIVTIEIGVIVYFWKRDRDTISRTFEEHAMKFERHEEMMLSLQEQVAENQRQTGLAIQALQINQTNDRERFEAFNEKFADAIVAKLRGITPQ